MGDVAMTVPVIKALLAQNPQVTVTYVSRPAFAAFFADIPRLTFFAADLKNDYNGFAGLLKLKSHLQKAGKYCAIADLHDSLRTKILRRLFRFSGVTVKYLDKGRAEKKLLTRFPYKVLKPLKRMHERYADVFRELGFIVELDYHLVNDSKPITAEITTVIGVKEQPWIGITPFAQYKGKTYPIEKMEEVVAALRAQNVKVFLFGGSPLEHEICAGWEAKYPNVISVIRKLNMQQELVLISQLNVMLSMDSAGMHLASLSGTPVVSIWGATHHYAGFLGYGQSEDNIVADDIECRPCSVYGNKPCFRKDYACLYNVHPQTVINNLLKFV
ncbi:MAG: lipopolysaccharide heptosyltransferase family protein [Sphingobacteriaceae bacterium]|nr:MAG: lipopolysaccharide heptosyltransferase family protein [Sphingobacteriaceae bacterium]